MKRLVIVALATLFAGQTWAACNANSLKGTWRYYQGVATDSTSSNTSRCQAAYVPSKTDKLSGTFQGYCWISPGKTPRTVAMYGSYTIEDAKTCDVFTATNMGAMGISRFHYVVSKDNDTWSGQWTNKGGDWGVTNGVKIMTTNARVPEEAVQPYPIDDYTANPDSTFNLVDPHPIP